jgi:hypothetical protein
MSLKIIFTEFFFSKLKIRTLQMLILKKIKKNLCTKGLKFMRFFFSLIDDYRE